MSYEHKIAVAKRSVNRPILNNWQNRPIQQSIRMLHYRHYAMHRAVREITWHGYRDKCIEKCACSNLRLCGYPVMSRLLTSAQHFIHGGPEKHRLTNKAYFSDITVCRRVFHEVWRSRTQYPAFETAWQSLKRITPNVRSSRRNCRKVANNSYCC